MGELIELLIGGLLSMVWVLIKVVAITTFALCLLLRCFGALSKNEVLEDLPWLTVMWWNRD